MKGREGAWRGAKKDWVEMVKNDMKGNNGLAIAGSLDHHAWKR